MLILVRIDDKGWLLEKMLPLQFYIAENGSLRRLELVFAIAEL